MHTLLSRVKKHPRMLGAGVLVLIGIAFLSLRGDDGAYETLTVSRGDFVETVSVSGTVEAGKNVDLGFAQSGRMAGIYADVGDTVYAGAVLAEMENGDLRAAVSQKKAVLASEEATLRSLEAGTRPEEVDVKRSALASAQSALVQANQALLDAVRNAYTVSDSAVLDKVDQFISNPHSQSPTLTFSVSDGGLKSKVEGGRVIVGTMLSAWRVQVDTLSTASDLFSPAGEAQSNLSSAGLFLSDTSNALSRALSSGSISQATINGYITDVATARANVNTAVTTLSSAQKSATAAAAALDTAAKDLALAEAGSTPEDIEAGKAKVAAAAADLQQAEAALRKTLIIAPFSGTVTRMDVKTGEAVTAGTSKIALIGTDVFQIKAFIPEVNIASVKVGDTAAATLDAYGPSMRFAAKVVAVDPAETIVGGIPTYKTTLQFLEKDDRIRSGMTADVTIRTRESADTIVVPSGAVITRGGEEFITVLVGDAPEERMVETGGTSSLGQIEIRSGLSEGDIVILNPNP